MAVSRIKIFFTKLFSFVFIVLAVLLNALWFSHGFGINGILLAIIINSIAVILLFAFLSQKREVVSVPVDEKKKLVRIDRFAGASAIALSSLFYFYAWSLIVGRELTSVENIRYRFYFDFIVFITDCCGVYSSAFVNFVFGTLFVFFGIKLIKNKFN